jgi:hypothetical protein
MALGTGPEALVDLFIDNWQQSRTGRDDVPPMYDPTQKIQLQKGVVVPLRNREQSGVDRGKHDILHCYHPEANPPAVTDRGYSEENVVETVQVDVDLTDRTDHSTGERLSARERMVSDRGSLASTSDPPYPGVLGEVKYVLEEVRRGYREWDTVSFDVQNLYLGNSNANAAITVELERVAKDTVV